MKTTCRTHAHHATLLATGHYTPDQAAQLLGVSVHTLEKWRRPGFEGIGRQYCLHGQLVRYDPRDLLKRSESRIVA
ncbi:helix-turn-helix domain-containing protein [Cellulosimicrobium cellulans]|uniref:helix-turn-helix domain-containing protein n=1 Tax=Cellulosimicrobium cellulans TaxID=1710 RepID=UPI00214A5C69|nr:helix-turn-helix domain-containing protein [Cellulosimicrobium cellulans]